MEGATMYGYKNRMEHVKRDHEREVRESFSEALALDLDATLSAAFTDTGRLSWVDAPVSVSTLDRWIELTQGTLDRLTLERERVKRGR